MILYVPSTFSNVKFAIFSDVHANLEALEAVLSVVGDLEIICLGDIVGYGPNPNECVQLVKRRAKFVVAGNHDWAAVGLTDYSHFNPAAKVAMYWTRSLLSEENMRYLRALPLILNLKELFGAHSAPCKPERWGYILSRNAAVDEFLCFGQDICFIGHSHRPLVIEQSDDVEGFNTKEYKLDPNCRYIVNVGSLGQPRDGNPDASWCIYDHEERKVQLMRTKYNVYGTVGKILKAGLPSVLGERLIFGV
jgi:diadenosine tetraphosphatase ApaH/serine/threonine PP2A family protein phosphatase